MSIGLKCCDKSCTYDATRIMYWPNPMPFGQPVCAIHCAGWQKVAEAMGFTLRFTDSYNALLEFAFREAQKVATDIKEAL